MVSMKTGAASQTCNLYFNTVYIAGVPTTGALNSFALYNNANSNTRNIRNNIFDNARSNGGTASGKHYAISLAGTTTLTINYNDYYAAGINGVLGALAGDQVTLANWQTATSQDGNSSNTDPAFVNAGGTTALDYRPGTSLTAVTGTG